MKTRSLLPPLLLLGIAFCAAPAAAQSRDRELSGWFAQIPSATPVKGGFKAKSVEVPLPGLMGGETLVIPDVSFTEAGVVLSSGTGTTPLEIRSVNGFRIQAQKYRLGALGIELGGSVFVPEALGGAAIAFDLGQMHLEPDGALISNPSKVPVVLKGDPLPLQAAAVSFDRNGMTVSKASTALPHSKSGIPVGRMVYLADGSLSESEGAADTGQPLSFDVNGILVEDVQGLTMGDEGLEFAGTLHLPPPYQEATQSYETLHFDKDGVLWRHWEEHQGFYATVQGFEINFPWLANFSSNDGFQFQKTSVQFPEAAGGTSFTISDLTLKPDGSIDLYGFDTPVLSVLGQALSFKSIGFDDQGFWGKGGWLRLPKDFPGELGGQALPVSSFRIDAKGAVKELKASLYYSSSVVLNDYWALDDAQVAPMQAKAGDPLRLTLAGTLILPQSLGEVYQLAVTQLPLDVQANRLVAEELKTAPLRFTLGGLRFDLKLLQASPRFDLVFAGTATEGKTTWQVDSLRLGHDGTLGAVTLSVPGKPAQASLAQWTAGQWNRQPYTPGVGLPVNQRLVVNQEGVKARTKPSDSAPVGVSLALGTVLVADATSPDVDTVGEATDHWYHFKNADGKLFWVFGAQVDVLK